MKFNILLIESNYAMRLFLNNFLEKSFNVTAYETAEDAVASLLADQIPDLIIQRYDNQAMNDIQAIRNNMLLRNLPVFMLTQEDKSDLRVAALKLQAVDCLSKPFNPQELVERLNIILNKKRSFIRELAS